MQIQKLKNKIDDLFSGGFNEKDHGIAFIGKVRMFNQVCFVGVITLIILGSIAVVNKIYLIGFLDLFFSGVLIFTIYYLRKTHRYNFLSISISLIIGMFFLSLFITGGVMNTGHLWFYTYPLFSFFLIDSKKGSIASATLLVSAIIYSLFQSNFPTFVQYSIDFMTRFVPSYLVIFLYSYLFEKNREKSYNIVNQKNEELSSTIEKLKTNEKELKKFHEELEQRVIERTIELKNINRQLVDEVELKNKATKAAESAIKMKTEFLAQMSHEIRTPVNSILSYTQLLKDEIIDKVPEDLRFSFDMINNGGRRLIRTIDLILNVSELQTGTYEPIIEKSDIVNDILKPLVGEFQSAANVKGLDLIFFNRLEKDESFFQIDIYTVTQIVANLIDNAIKYTGEGSIEVVAYKTKENLYSVDIQDTSIGISRKFQETLFEAFTQEEQGYTRKFEGNGLGMALVKEYCKINNIQISVRSEKGEGSTFTITFPQTQINLKDAA